MVQTISAPRHASAGLPFYSRYTRTLHLRAEVLNNLFAGVIGLAGAVARKGLNASDLGITILTTAGSAALLTALFWSHFMEGRSKRPFILASALLGRASLVLMAFAVDPRIFIGICCVYFLSEPIFIPAQNALLQANYHPSIRGTVFGTITAISKIAFLLSAFGAGFILDAHPRAYLWLFPLAGALGTVAYLQYARIRIRRWVAPAHDAPRGLLAALRSFFKIMRSDRDFDRFERNFMIYGMAFMMILPLNVFLLIDELRLSYLQVSLCTLVLFQVVNAATSRLGGRLLDRIGAPRVAALSFAVLVGHAGTLAAAAVFHSIPLAFAAFAFFGVAMSGVNAAWSLGAMRFAGDRDAAAYMGVHVACVGFRGLFGPTLGYGLVLVLDHPSVGAPGLGLPAVYAIAAALFGTAAVAMSRLGKGMERAAARRTPPAPVAVATDTA